MATAMIAQRKVRADDIFFPAMALLILGIVVTGFGKSYFLAGMVLAKLPNNLVHFHGAVFVLWISLVFAATVADRCAQGEVAHEVGCPRHSTGSFDVDFGRPHTV